ncbi:unnamed protein product, partial [Symbiodinium pilosum]
TVLQAVLNFGADPTPLCYTARTVDELRHSLYHPKLDFWNIAVEHAEYESLIIDWAKRCGAILKRHRLAAKPQRLAAAAKRAAERGWLLGMRQCLSELDKLACLSEHVANKFDMVELETLREELALVAIKAGAANVVEFLVPRWQKMPPSLICCACAHGKQEIAAFLLEKGADLCMSTHGKVGYFNSPLDMAVKHCHINVVDFLCEVLKSDPRAKRPGTAAQEGLEGVEHAESRVHGHAGCVRSGQADLPPSFYSPSVRGCT